VDPATIRVNKRMSTALSGALRNESVEPRSGFIGIKGPQVRPMTTAKVHSPSPDFKPSNTNNLKEGMLVEHPKFGFGKVLRIEVEGLNRKATIQFENFGEKTLLLSFAKLRIID
jgi:DNA helicase-2/ATP-dependent DNA helicase PcrA